MPVKFMRLTLLCALVSVTQLSFSQELFIRHGIKMPADSVTARAVTSAVTMFLHDKSKPNKDNAYVLQSELLPTYCLLDEIKGMDDYEGVSKEKGYYQCLLTSIVQMDTDSYLLQISYLSGKGGVGTLHGSFRLLAKRVDGKFYICSPLRQNTGDWKTKTYGLLTCHYKTNSNVNDGKALQAIITAYNQKLGIPNGPVVIYTFNNSVEAQQALGIDYKQEYNGVKDDWFSDHGNNAAIVLASDPQYPHGFDAHDLWHERLRMVMDRAIINRPVDEGCAYLYGGSWGYSAAEVMAMFKQYAAANPNADWLSLYINSTPFQTGNKPMYIAYVLNALIAKKLEKEKGFAAVKQLLACGPRQKGDENYFAALEKVSGISKADFNTEMWKLVKAER